MRGRKALTPDLDWVPNRALSAFWKGFVFGRVRYHDQEAARDPAESGSLEKYFDAHTEGPGIWKWRHYFDIYERHFARFKQREVHVLEIGVFSGGSLAMWHEYFGPESQIYGVDIEAACRAYEAPGTRIFVGDQADRSFWLEVISDLPRIDIVIDDGGHVPNQQIVSFEMLLPHLAPGGVYLCEDVHGEFNSFASYFDGWSRNLHGQSGRSLDRGFVPNEVQRSVESVHVYPYVTVVEKRSRTIDKLIAPKHGTEWQPFLGVRVPEATDAID